MKSVILLAAALGARLGSGSFAGPGRSQGLPERRACRRRRRPHGPSWRNGRDRRLHRRPSHGQRKGQAEQAAQNLRPEPHPQDSARRNAAINAAPYALLLRARSDFGSSGQRGAGGRVEPVRHAEAQPLDPRPGDHGAVVGAKLLRRGDHRETRPRRRSARARRAAPHWRRRRRPPPRARRDPEPSRGRALAPSACGPRPHRRSPPGTRRRGRRRRAAATAPPPPRRAGQRSSGRIARNRRWAARASAAADAKRSGSPVGGRLFDRRSAGKGEARGAWPSCRKPRRWRRPSSRRDDRNRRPP